MTSASSRRVVDQTGAAAPAPVAKLHEMTTASAPPPATVNWSRVEDGLITVIRVTFAPRPLLGGARRLRGAVDTT